MHSLNVYSLWCDVAQACIGHTLHVRRAQPQPVALEYCMKSQCLVALYEDGYVDEWSTWYTSALAVLDLAAGGRIVCRLGDRMCAMQTPALVQGVRASH